MDARASLRTMLGTGKNLWGTLAGFWKKYRFEKKTWPPFFIMKKSLGPSYFYAKKVLAPHFFQEKKS